MTTRRSAIALTTLALNLLAGCAGPGRFEAGMDRYVGKSESELVAGLGRPQRRWPLADGSHVLRFVHQRTVQYSGPLRPIEDKPPVDPTAGLPAGTYDPAGSVFRAASAARAPVDEASVCAVDFTVDRGGTVRGWAAQQGDCRAK